MLTAEGMKGLVGLGVEKSLAIMTQLGTVFKTTRIEEEKLIPSLEESCV